MGEKCGIDVVARSNEVQEEENKRRYLHLPRLSALFMIK